MSQRWRWAIEATQTNDLVALAKFLTGAAHEAHSESSMPHMDPAVRMIAYQIALVGNGDMPFHKLYKKMYDYCAAKADQGPNYEYGANPSADVMPIYEPN